MDAGSESQWSRENKHLKLFTATEVDNQAEHVSGAENGAERA